MWVGRCDLQRSDTVSAAIPERLIVALCVCVPGKPEVCSPSLLTHTTCPETFACTDESMHASVHTHMAFVV